MMHLLLGLGLMVAVFVGAIEGACDVRSADLSAPANAKIVTDLRASPRAPKNVIVFDPTPNIDMFFAAFDGSDIGYRNATNNRPKALIWADVACLGYNGGCSIRVSKIARHYPIKNPKACPRIASSGGSHSTIFPFNAKVMADNIFARLVVDMLPHYFGIRNDIRSYLPLADISCHIDGPLSGQISLAGKVEGDDQQGSADSDESGRDKRVQSHTLGGFIYRLRSSVHALLGDKIVFLVLAGFGFAALAGLGGGFILDNVNQERNRKRLGWLLLCCGFPLFALSFLLGLP